MHLLQSFKGLELHTYAWKVPEAKGAVVGIHGYTSFAEMEFLAYPGKTYSGSAIEAFNSVGFSFYSVDLQGFGRSEGYGGLRGS